MFEREPSLSVERFTKAGADAQNSCHHLSHPSMCNFDSEVHANTPQISVIDSRGLSVRSISYCRHPDSLSVTEERITRQRFNPLGQLSQSIDPRLFELQQADSTLEPNLSNWFSLTGTVLRTDAVI